MVALKLGLIQSLTPVLLRTILAATLISRLNNARRSDWLSESREVESNKILATGHRGLELCLHFINMYVSSCILIRGFKIGQYGRLGRLEAYTGGLGP